MKRKVALIATGLVLVLATACQPAPPPRVYHYTETGRLVGYSAAGGSIVVEGTMAGEIYESQDQRCFDERGLKRPVRMDCSALTRNIGATVRITWHGNPETGAEHLDTITIIK